MKFYCALAILAVLTAVKADPEEPCSKQLESEMRCKINVITSPEAKMIKDRMKQIFKTCAPDYPEECHAEMEAAFECTTSIFKTADTDPAFQESKQKSRPAVDQCIAQNPPNVMKGFKSISMALKPPKVPKRWLRKEMNESSSTEASSASQEGTSQEVDHDSGSSSNETSASFERGHGGGGRGGGGRHHGGGGRHHGGGGRGHGGRGRGGRGRGGRCPHHHGRHHGPRNFTSGEASDENSASSSQENSGEKGMMRPQCRKTGEQKKCVKDSMKKLGEDSSFVQFMNILMKQKKKCSSLVSWSCEAKCPKRQKCIFEATKPCRDVFMGKMRTCMQEKGFTLPPFMEKGHLIDTLTTPVPLLDD